jgi:RNA polymerase sigma-70 factor (ECF subfamily)
MVDVNGLDYIEAAESLGKPVGTVKSRLNRARQRFAELIAPHLD